MSDTPIPTLGAVEQRILELYRQRIADAGTAWQAAVRKAGQSWTGDARPAEGANPWQDAVAYGVDFAQRTALFWDTLRRRGNEWIEHEKAGKPPLLKFKSMMVADARTFARPVNYALLRIEPPETVGTDPAKRPFVIIDPRAGHGPGIGGFKEESEVGVALRAGHPVYFVVFFPEPCPGQTLADVSVAEAEFLRIVRSRHPDSGKPVLVGNCQGGWAAMLLGAIDPDLPGPIVINGAPVSYWAGNDENPMRYAGGVLGGVWPALLASDLGGGIFDGAYLVENFEGLNPANTYFDKYYTLFSKVDSEPERFLEFERWWGGFFLMNRAEIKWIVENLFVGNRLAAGEAEWSPGRAFDLRAIRSPIVVFASLGDNITPPQQAINWVADLYPTTEDLKANGQVIVGLVHQTVGHLGIFVSGAVAAKEHAQIVDLLEYINGLPPGLYAMQIEEHRDGDGAPRYDVTLTEHRVEELRRIQAWGRRDEVPFAAVDELSQRLEQAYETFVHPLLAPLVSPELAKAARLFHPLRMQRWALSDLNPVMAGVRAAADLARANRTPRPATGPAVAAERLGAALTSAGWDFLRDVRDATSEFLFFQIYAPMSFGLPTERVGRDVDGPSEATEAALRSALGRAEAGGFAEATVRTALLFVKAGTGRRRLSAIKRAREAVGTSWQVLGVPQEAVAELLREQSLIVEADPRRAFETLPVLLKTREERERLLDLLRRLDGTFEVNARQHELYGRLEALLRGNAPAAPAAALAAPVRALPRRREAKA